MTDPHHAIDDPAFSGSIHFDGQSVPTDAFVRTAKLIKVVDGDTLRFEINQGFGSKLMFDIRLSGCDTPEPRGKESAAGKWVTQRVLDWVAGRTDFVIWSRTFEVGKYGRCLATAWLDGACLNDWLLAKGYAWATDDKGRIIGERNVDRLTLPDEIKQQVRLGS